MLAELASGLSSVQALTKIAQGLNAMSTQAQVNDVKISLQNNIIAIQAALMAAQLAEAKAAERIRELEQQIVGFEDWEREKQRYELKAVWLGAFAYMLKPGMENGEPPQWFCTDCFKRRHVSALQSRGNQDPKTGTRSDNAQWVCNTCKGSITTFYRRRPSEPWEPPAPEKKA